MKKSLFVLSTFFLMLSAHAQTQTEDEIFIGKGKTFGNYKGIIIPDVDRSIKTIKGVTVLTGTVAGMCKAECCFKLNTSCFMTVQRDDSLVSIGARDYGITIPKSLQGRNIIVEGIDVVSSPRRRNPAYRQNMQYEATGIKVLD